MRRIADYQIRTVYGEIFQASIEDMEMLVTHIREHGLSNIAKVSFYLEEEDESEDSEFRNVIVRQHEAALFVPEFCDERAQEDWELVLGVLKYKNLDDMFIKYIQTPSYS